MSSALLLIDIQNDYFPGGRMELEGSVEAAEKAAVVLTQFRDRGLPVFHVRHESLQKGATFFLPGTDGADIHSIVFPLAGEVVITKHYPNSFRETDLLARLEAAGITRLVVAGMMTHMCVDAGVRAATDYGFACAVLSDATATRALEFHGQVLSAAQVHGSFLAALGMAYAKVIPSADVSSWLQAGSLRQVRG
ncbi:MULTISPECIES: cysteine hydrolase family protein [unclassified Pseudodesulfovibrio]|uniref:cysteine hydrolase family protein n=1 Tax=unclassified Pseudodesulfovibrio TaxID=2661612 RepID=UPI000FEBAE5D|nr:MULTISPECIES: cysteine hydrolase family protein [unclassified Pseudodesulfovibrio]MCJ2165892.1 cysteine hydrolase [Pseudodesulfovibrio sp. S3-i]RWU02674.1 cysteine hydrolase [Pseudodesulfovibrio sp. S3]